MYLPRAQTTVNHRLGLGLETLMCLESHWSGGGDVAAKGLGKKRKEKEKGTPQSRLQARGSVFSN